MIQQKTHILEKSGFSVMLSANQIAVFFDHQYLWKESIDLLVFLHGDNHQRKIASETTTLDVIWAIVLPTQSDCRIL